MIFNAYSNSKNGIFNISPVSAGHIFATSGRKISRPSGRDDWLLFYVAKGCEHFILEREYEVREGDFIFFKPHEPQEHICLDERTSEFYYVHFSAPLDFDLFGFESSKVYEAKKSSKITDLFEEIIHELQTKEHFYGEITTAKLFLIITLLARRVSAQNDPNKEYSDKISFVIQMMNREYDKNYSLEEYAKICNMSKFHFIRVFEKIVGESPIEYRNNIRIEHAKELLLDTTHSISKIGESVGYTSSVYFCDAFKKKVGISPLKYRRQNNRHLT